MPIRRKINDIDIRLLRIFKGVADSGGFSAAEAELNIARSTISTHMADLEARLNLKLCHRGRSGFSLTEEGQFVYECAEQLLGSLEQFRSQVNTLHQQLTGELNIVCSDAIVADPQFKLANAITAFETVAPEVQINLASNTLPEIERALIDGRADIAFAPWHRELSSIDYTALYTERHKLYCHRSHALFALENKHISNKAICECKFIHPGMQTSGAASKAMIDLNRSASAYIYEARMSLVKTGHYIGFFSSHYAQPGIDAGELRALLPNKRFYDVEVAMMLKKGRRKNKVLEAFQSCWK